MTPTNTDEDLPVETGEKVLVYSKYQDTSMYKIMFLAFSICAIYPEWPVDAVNASQELLDGFQSTLVALQDSTT